MEISMQDGRVMASIGNMRFPLTLLPMEWWNEGEDVVNHPALERWNADCNRKYVTDED